MDAEAVLPQRSQQVAQALAAAGATGRIREMPGDVRTAAEAAASLSCEVGAIANSLIFLSGGSPVLVLASGARKIDTTALADRMSWEPLRRATPDEVREATGQVIGGVAPLGHPQALPTVVDSSLQNYLVVWAAGGTPRTLFPTTHDELARLSAGTTISRRGTKTAPATSHRAS